jgi:hypothetical protein
MPRGRAGARSPAPRHTHGSGHALAQASPWRRTCPGAGHAKRPARMCGPLRSRATPTGLEPATSAVTGRRANQLRYGALMVLLLRIPNGIRTRATAVKGRGPRPLDDGDQFNGPPPLAPGADPSRTRESIRADRPDIQNGPAAPLSAGLCTDPRLSLQRAAQREEGQTSVHRAALTGRAWPTPAAGRRPRSSRSGRGRCRVVRRARSRRPSSPAGRGRARRSRWRTGSRSPSPA